MLTLATRTRDRCAWSDQLLWLMDIGEPWERSWPTLLPAFPGRVLKVLAQGLVGVCGQLHPLQGKSFRKSVSTVMDDLGLISVIIDNINMIQKLDN